MPSRICSALLSVSLASSLASAAPPVADMSRQSLAVEYSARLRGQIITSAAVPSHERLHTLSLHYAPLPYGMLSLGIGLDRFRVDEHNGVRFAGKHGFSPSAALSLFTPRFTAVKLGAGGGAAIAGFNSRDSHDGQYRGSLVSPFLGICIQPLRMLEVEAGGRGHIIFGKMKSGSAAATGFSNKELVRGYLNVTLHSADRGAFLEAEFDASPKIGSDWSGGPNEASLGLSVGFILRGDRKSAAPQPDRRSRYFPKQADMKKKLDDMEKQLNE